MKSKSILIVVAAIASIMTINAYGSALADPQHCDRPGWPSCYDAGHQAAISGIPCPNGHSKNYCRGWDDANGGSAGSGSISSDSNRHDNTPSGLGFRPEDTHCDDLDTSPTGGVNYDDGYDQGYVDAHRDFRGLNGHGFDDSVNHGSVEYKSGYVKGYNDGWDDAQKGIQDPKC
jgi:hypothetical protein